MDSHLPPLNIKMGLVIGIPFSRPVMPEWAISLAIQTWPTDLANCYIPMRGLPVDQARIAIVESARRLDAPWIFMVDDDVEIPQWTIRQLMNTIKQADDDVMVVGGIYPSRTNPTEPIVYKGHGQGVYWKWRRGEIFEVDAIGTGCMLIRTEVFDKIERPWFKTVKETATDVTDDIWFCAKVREKGYRILADGSVICVHWDNANQQRYELDPNSYPMKTEAEIAECAISNR